MTTLNNFSSNQSLSERIDYYNKLDNNLKKLKQHSEFHQKIIDDVSLLIYKLPQKYLKLNEEDACDFLLYMSPKINGIIEKYNKTISEDFTSFIYPILARKLITFKNYNNTKMERETAISQYHTYYEYEIQQNEYDGGLSAAERYEFEDQKSIKFLNYLFFNTKSSKKRFFIFLMTMATSLENYLINSICDTFNYNKPETFYLINTICQNAKQSERTKKLYERRNLSWTRMIFLQAERVKHNYYENYPKIDELDKKITFYKNICRKQNDILFSKHTNTNRNVVAKSLGISSGTLGSSCFYIKNILIYCQNMDVIPEKNNMGISPNLFEEIRTGRWEHSYFPKENSKFSPFNEFGIR